MLCTPRLNCSLAMDRDMPITGTAVPIKMKRKTLKHLSQAERLEIENKRMEERLHSLKLEMLREKEERESSGGVHWNSGKMGPLASHAADVLKKNQKVESQKLPLKIKVLTDCNIETSTPPKRDVKKGRAAADCITERQDSYQRETTVNVVGLGDQKQLKSSCAVGTTSSDTSSSGGGGGLLWGNYDEEASTKSFQDAVQAWRDSGKKPTMQTVTSTCEVQAGVAELVSKTRVKGYDVLLNGGSSGLNYMEQMLLRKMRSNTPPIQLAVQTPMTPTEWETSQDEVDGEATIESQVVGGYAFDINSGDDISVTGHHMEEELIVTEVSDSELVGLEDSIPAVEAIVDEVSDDSEIIDEEAVCPPVVPTVDNVSADTPDLKRENKQENIMEPSDGKPSSQSSRNSLQTKIVTRQTKSRRKKRSQARVSKKAEPTDSKQQTGIVNPVPMAWSQSRPYSGLGGFFLAAVNNEALEPEKNRTTDNTTLSKSDINFPLLTTTTTWKPLTSLVDGPDWGGLVDITHIVDPAQFRRDSDSDEDDESLPVYMRPSSVLQNRDLNEASHEDNEEDMKTLEDLALELQSLSRVEQKQNSPVLSVSDSDRSIQMDDDSVSVDSPGQTVRRLDIDTLMDDFEEMESKIMQGHECQ